jgi:hypothetical protein
MNKVNKTIKCLLLAFPSFYPSRWAALRLMFLTPGAGGFSWNDKGCLVTPGNVPEYKAAKKGVMDFSDLDRDGQNLEDMCRQFPSDAPHQAIKRFKLSQARALRQHRAETIDTVVMHHIEDPSKGDLEELCDLVHSLSGTALSNIPFDKLDKDWAAAVLETVDIVHDRLARALGLEEGEEIRLMEVPKRWHPLCRLIKQVRKELAAHAKPSLSEAAVTDIKNLWSSVLSQARGQSSNLKTAAA